MVDESKLNQFIVSRDCVDGNIDYAKLGQILIDTIPADKKDLWAYKVMAYLASKAMECEGNEPTRLSTKHIHVDLDGSSNQEPSQWLSPIWKEIEDRFYPEIEQNLIDKCRKNGLAVYPVLEKERGRASHYRIAARALPSPGPGECQDDEVVLQGEIRYSRDLSLKLSALGKLVFSHGFEWTPGRRKGFLAWNALLMFASIVFVFLIWLVLSHRTVPLTGQDLAMFAMGIGFPWGMYIFFLGIVRLFDDRIMIAPDWALAWKEFGATVEIVRSRNPDVPSTILVQRYTAICPVCGWMVKLDRGEPDFPRRIVGRCEENPREHVFSFDRSSRKGGVIHSRIGFQIHSDK